ncbi:ComF family protein [Candidatus Magnetobacterium casense]|uniref:ComF family protein n=1 Tax=Candidatus Magnetobacterium casense TaxID=1455061 RepID=A0ABS6RYD1_9BACT|nr:ComF family protein [Candidatus Magnetobacterium casensis]MBV6341652.1 ComF family protein [Candidatus Magnetobacterium casensis]
MSSGTIHRFLNWLAGLLFPQSCPMCLQPSDSISTAPICSRCWSTLRPMTEAHCSVCCRPLAESSGDDSDVMCQDCRDVRPLYRAAFVFGVYEGVLREAIIRYKFSPIKRLAGPLGDLICSLPIPKVDMITAIPVTKKRLIERGFNQTLLLAHRLSEEFGIAVADDAALKIRDTGHQVHLSREERLRALKDAFEVSRDVRDKRILLVDDVLTTGATVNECTKVLLDAGAKEVYVAVLARTV